MKIVRPNRETGLVRGMFVGGMKLKTLSIFIPLTVIPLAILSLATGGRCRPPGPAVISLKNQGESRWIKLNQGESSLFETFFSGKNPIKLQALTCWSSTVIYLHV
jgi:hypothetical protein